MGAECSIAIIHYAGPPIIGGVEITIHHHARLLAQEGYHVQVIAGRGNHFHPQVDFHKIPKIDSRHPEVLLIGEALARGKVPSQFANLRDDLIAILYPLLSNIDVCIVHNVITLHKNLPLTAALHRMSNEGITHLIAWCHDLAWRDTLYTPDLHSGYPWDLLRTPWHGVLYIAVSNHSRANLSDLTGLEEKKIGVVHPGVDIADIFKMESDTLNLIEKLDLLNADPIILLPARITRRKNIELGIQVIASLLRYKPRALLIVTGPPGPHNPANIAYLEVLKKLRVELKVTDHVLFLYESGKEGGPFYVSDAMMADLYHLADLLLFPSRREGFGIPVLEAGLVRLPIFASDIPSLRESTVGHIQYFDPENDPASVAESIFEYLKVDPIYQFRQRVLNHFTWQAIVKQKVIPIIHEASNLSEKTNLG